MWVSVGKISMHLNIHSECFFLIHRSSFGHLKAILRYILSCQQVINLVNGTNLCRV